MSEPTEPANSDSLEQEILSFGRNIFTEISAAKPSAFNKKAFSGKLMQWSMAREDLKTNMFRLVDVLPTLKSSRSIAKHTREYLEEPVANISELLALPLKLSDNFLSSHITSLAVKSSINQMARDFIAGSDPKSALKALKRIRSEGMTFTVDLLGEFSLSEKEALVYLERYIQALDVFGKEIPGWKESSPIIANHPGELSSVCISVKLSALYSQCNPLNFEKSVSVLTDRLTQIVRKAAQIKAITYVDAEDSANNPIIYQVFKNVFGSSEFVNFPYPGIVVQAYSKNSRQTLEDLIEFSKERGNPIAVRLVKGAYWDYETIVSQQNDWPSPLFSRKESSDANFEALSKFLLDNHKHCLPAFGSHNIRSLSHACCYAREKGLGIESFELQMLYGMADPIAAAFKKLGYLVRFYVPLGEILPGMGYLVRRLLENTSNESFLKHTFFDASDVEKLLAAPRMIG